MAGIYIHIPFCRQPCHYCNFHFMASTRDKDAYLKALLHEMALQRDFFDLKEQGRNFSGVKTVYVGGGTPSVLSASELSLLFEGLSRHFSMEGMTEVTLEANPDDLSKQKLRELRQLPVNRLSIGVQSFFPEDLHYMNRVHSPSQAWSSVQNAREAGFDNISVDLIYGTPTLTDANWNENLHRLAMDGIPHISAYALTVEPGTPLAHFIRKGKAQPVSEEQSARQFEIMKDVLEAYGYRHYEISNFSFPGRESRHNMAYWTGLPYLGLGTSAHSFISGKRSWNVSNISQYTAALSEGVIPAEEEILSLSQAINEYIMTSLRTVWGCDLKFIERLGGGQYTADLKKRAEVYLHRGALIWKDSHTLVLGKKGLFFADGIAADLFVD
ncbi:MAG: radical SAM family heme chaperone HemW [Bacteroidales bacterium]